MVAREPTRDKITQSYTHIHMSESNICSVDCTNVSFLVVILNSVTQGTDVGGAGWKARKISLYVSL